MCKAGSGQPNSLFPTERTAALWWRWGVWIICVAIGSLLLFNLCGKPNHIIWMGMVFLVVNGAGASVWIPVLRRSRGRILARTILLLHLLLFASGVIILASQFQHAQQMQEAIEQVRRQGYSI